MDIVHCKGSKDLHSPVNGSRICWGLLHALNLIQTQWALNKGGPDVISSATSFEQSLFKASPLIRGATTWHFGEKLLVNKYL